MKCKYCDNEIVELCLVPSENDEIWSCIDCAKENNLYCEKHELIHTSFADNSHACLVCIEDSVHTNDYLAIGYDNRIRKALPDDEIRLLDEWVSEASMIADDPHSARTTLRAIMTYSMRRNINPDDIVLEIEDIKTIQHLLPLYFI